MVVDSDILLMKNKISRFTPVSLFAPGYPTSLSNFEYFQVDNPYMGQRIQDWTK